MARAAGEKRFIVTRRGEPYVRLLPGTLAPGAPGRYPLRDPLRRMDRGFDMPLPGLWKALGR